MRCQRAAVATKSSALPARRASTSQCPRRSSANSFAPTARQQRANFTKKLGFTIATDQPFNDQQRWIELKIPGADARLVLFTPEGHENRIGGFQPIAFYSNDVKKTYDELTSRGVDFVGPPQMADWGSSAIFKDVDGNQFVLSSK